MRRLLFVLLISAGAAMASCRTSGPVTTTVTVEMPPASTPASVIMPSPTVVDGTVLHKFGQRIDEMNGALRYCREKYDRSNGGDPMGWFCQLPDLQFARLIDEISGFAQARKDAARYVNVIGYGGRVAKLRDKAFSDHCPRPDYMVTTTQSACLDLWRDIESQWRFLTSELIRLDTA
ncbi:hypothetical protein [Amycolatopsis sp. NPDC059657]|uniref:hypothetical protein n=1 Tax=Amycolatopsis sp. NPDC059657 TaxID=3346899 RepID=UPI0036731E65